MTLRPLHRLCRLFQAQYRNSAVAYLLFRRLLVQRLAGQEAPWLKLFFRNSAPVLPPELQRQANALLAQLPVRPEGAPDGLTPQTLALAHEIFAANGKAKGIFYTPFSLARHLARQALHVVLIRQAGLDEATAQALLEGTSPAEPLARQTDAWLSRLTCCDPAAGAGGLLVPFALELSRLRKTLCPDRDEGELLAFILSRNLFAADLSAPALEDLQLRAALVLAQYGRTPSARPLAQVFQGDVLAQANGQSVLEKAFEPVFSQRGGFDVILSNPPYIGQKNHRAVFEALRHNPLWEKLAEPKSDLLYFFFYLALKTLKPGGIGAFLTTPYFASAAGGQKLRQTLREQAAFLYLEDFGEQRLFRRALGQHSLLSVFEKNDSAAKPPCLMDCRQLPQNSLYQGPEHYLITRPAAPALKSALDKMAACPHTLQDVAHVSNGLMTGCDKISAAHLRRHRLPGVKKGDGVFVLSPAEKGALPLTPTEEAKLKPFFKNSDLHP